MVNEKVKQVEKACKCVRKHQSATPTLSNVAKNNPPKLRFLLIQTDNGGRVALCSTAATWMVEKGPWTEAERLHIPTQDAIISFGVQNITQ